MILKCIAVTQFLSTFFRFVICFKFRCRFTVSRLVRSFAHSGRVVVEFPLFPGRERDDVCEFIVKVSCLPVN